MPKGHVWSHKLLYSSPLYVWWRRRSKQQNHPSNFFLRVLHGCLAVKRATRISKQTWVTKQLSSPWTLLNETKSTLLQHLMLTDTDDVRCGHYRLLLYAQRWTRGTNDKVITESLDLGVNWTSFLSRSFSVANFFRSGPWSRVQTSTSLSFWWPSWDRNTSTARAPLFLK